MLIELEMTPKPTKVEDVPKCQEQDQELSKSSVTGESVNSISFLRHVISTSTPVKKAKRGEDESSRGITLLHGVFPCEPSLMPFSLKHPKVQTLL